MKRNSFLNSLSKYAIIWTPLLTLIYFGYIVLSFWYRLSIFQYLFIYLIYLCTVLIIFGIILIPISNGHLGVKIIVFSLTTVLFCVGSLSLFLFPSLLAKEKIDQNYFYLLVEPELFLAHSQVHLYKCSDFLSCQQTSFYSRDPSQTNFQLIKDKETNEVHVMATFINGQAYLIYTYGATSRQYEHPEKFEEHLYYLAFERVSDKFENKYTIYECQLDNTYCTPIPFKYVSNRRNNVELFTNDNSIKVKAYNFDTKAYTLIFIYDGQPYCYMEGCEILEETK